MFTLVVPFEVALESPDEAIDTTTPEDQAEEAEQLEKSGLSSFKSKQVQPIDPISGEVQAHHRRRKQRP